MNYKNIKDMSTIELIKALRGYASERKGDIADLTNTAADKLEELMHVIELGAIQGVTLNDLYYKIGDLQPDSLWLPDIRVGFLKGTGAAMQLLESILGKEIEENANEEL